MLLSGRLGLTTMLSIAPLVLASASSAQQTEKPDAPRAALAPIDENEKVIDALAPYRPITGKERVRWAARQAFGRESLLEGAVRSGLATAKDSPQEYGPHWDGFGKRYGMRLTGLAASSTIEGGLGAIWDEDPRYVCNRSLPLKGRIRNVFLLAFIARRRDGRLMPAYARYVAIPGSNFLSNTWRVDSEATTTGALTRTGYGFLGKIAGNAWSEFWPDIKRRVFKK
jgi:hypothetical protein